MAATVTIRRWTGASGSPTKTDITAAKTRMKTADDGTVDTNNPIPIPSSGTNYSFWCCGRLSADTSPAGTINNLKWYTDGTNSLGTGVTAKGNTATGYVQATGTVGTTGNVLNTTNYSTLAAATSDIFTFTSAAPKSVTGTISNPTTGDFGDFMVYQIEVGTTAGAGTTPAETFTWQTDYIGPNMTRLEGFAS